MLSKFKRDNAAIYGIKRMGIFGSVARGEHKDDSDLDVFVDVDKVNLLDLGGLAYDLEKQLGTPVDIVYKGAKLRPTFLNRIEREMIYV
jgi:predicted nucleotidyltransferase